MQWNKSFNGRTLCVSACVFETNMQVSHHSLHFLGDDALCCRGVSVTGFAAHIAATGLGC